MAMRLQGKTALITGGSTGIELAGARLLAAEGVVRSGRLFLLELSGDRIHSMNPDGSDRNTIVMAGSVYSADLDGKNGRNFLYGQGNLTGVAYAEI